MFVSFQKRDRSPWYAVVGGWSNTRVEVRARARAEIVDDTKANTRQFRSCQVSSYYLVFIAFSFLFFCVCFPLVWPVFVDACMYVRGSFYSEKGGGKFKVLVFCPVYIALLTVPYCPIILLTQVVVYFRIRWALVTPLCFVRALLIFFMESTTAGLWKGFFV